MGRRLRPLRSRSTTSVPPRSSASNFGFTEGPVWNHAEGVLYFTDIAKSAVFRLSRPNEVGLVALPYDLTDAPGHPRPGEWSRVRPSGTASACRPETPSNRPARHRAHGTRRLLRGTPPELSERHCGAFRRHDLLHRPGLRVLRSGTRSPGHLPHRNLRQALIGSGRRGCTQRDRPLSG